MPNFNELVAEYKATEATITDRQKADLEEAVYQAATLERVRKSGEDRNDFLSKTIGIHKYDCSNRGGLRGRGAKVDPLWHRVESDSLPVRTAVELARKAEAEQYNSKGTFEEALAKVLAEYDSKPLTLLPSGKFIKVRRGGARNKRGGGDKVAETQRTPISTDDTPIARSARDTWRVIRQLTESMLKERMAGCDPIFIETTSRDFGVDLSALVESYQSRINRMGSSLRGESLIPSGKEMATVNDACRTLNLDEIDEVGDIIDIIRARKNAKAFLAKFHPDKNPGENQKLFERKYQAVVNALGVIEEYNEKHGAHNAGNAV
jgi:hypothetical protein